MYKNFPSVKMFKQIGRNLEIMCYLIPLLFLMVLSTTAGHIAGKGEPRPPFSRQVRGPTVPSSEEEYSKGLMLLKSPAYQLRFRPSQRLSQFHSYSTVPHTILPALPNSGLNIFNIPGMTQLHPKNSQSRLEDTETESEPTFTPFISARALSNMERFFEHLKDNIKALHKDQGDQSIIPSEDNSDGVDLTDADFDWDNINDEARALATILKPHSPDFLSNSQIWLPPASGSLLLNRVNRNKEDSNEEESGDIKRFEGFHPSLSRLGLGRKRRR